MKYALFILSIAFIADLQLTEATRSFFRQGTGRHRCFLILLNDSQKRRRLNPVHTNGRKHALRSFAG